jgi:hypothetical protein
MTTWIVGDIHGCAQELDALLALLRLGPSDTLVSCGDLFHRGPDAGGVMDLLERARARFVLGNHELVPLARFGLAPTSTAPREPHGAVLEPAPARAAARGASAGAELDAEDLNGDGDEPCHVAAARRAELLRFLQRHDGYYLRPEHLAGAGPTLDGRSWCVLHAGLPPGVAPEHAAVRDLVGRRKLALPGNPWWYELYDGDELVIFGHTPSPLPRMHRRGGALVALGLDTGCVYGGRLTAYSPELDEFVTVRAQRAWADGRGLYAARR